jgi:hypothetical protein
MIGLFNASLRGVKPLLQFQTCRHGIFAPLEKWLASIAFNPRAEVRPVSVQMHG